jgi:hypothetical protein
MPLTQVNPALLDTQAQYTGFKNRIINGAMVIDQRNAGASVTQTTSDLYIVDRWAAYGTAASKFSVQQNAGAVTPPSGFTSYLGCTSLSAYSLASTDFFTIGQKIEGFNFSDLGWGSANAQAVTLSFWARSSLTGTFSGYLPNGGSGAYWYVFSYTINSANTWEYKTVTIAAPTAGGTASWPINNAQVTQIQFSLGTGSSVTGAAGAWGSTTARGVTGTTSVVGTNGATFYITGVQLEKGSTATSFDYRPYGTELALCQRYYEKLQGVRLWGSNANLSYATWAFKAQKRASPTITLASGSVGTLENTSVDNTQAYTNGYARIEGGSSAEIEL